MSDYKLPDLPSDDELGIEGLSEEDFLDDPVDEAGPLRADPPAGARPDPPVGPPPPVPPKAAPASVPAGSPPPVWRGPLTLLVLLVAAWGSRPERTMPSPRPANAPDSVFASARALTELVDITRAPHPTGSPAHAEVRALLTDRLSDLGLDPEIQTTTYLLDQGEGATGATVRNILARVPGTASTGAIVLTAHYDSRTFSHGAGDDATGVATILETLRALRSAPPLRNDLIVLISDAEELGLLGARAFVDRHPWMDDVRLVISVEMRGGGGPSIMFETKSENGWVIERLDAVDPNPLANSVSVDIYRRMPRDTDFTPFRQSGVQGLNFAAIGRAHLYHQIYDTSENLDEATLQHHGVRVLGLTRDLGDRDLGTVDGPDRAFVTLPILGLLTYPVTLALPLTAGLAVLLILVLVTTRARGGDARSLLIGMGLGLLATALAAGVGQGLLIWARGRHPEYGALMGSAFHVEGWYVAALAAFALALVTVSLGALTAKLHRAALLLGAMMPATLLALALGFVAPAAAPNLQGPAAAGLLAVLVLALARKGGSTGWLVWGLTLLLALPVLGFLVIVIELVWLAMSFTLAAVIGGALAVTLLLLTPTLEALRPPNRWWAPATSLAVGALFVVVGSILASPSADRPAPSTLLYVQDQGGPGAPVRALWATRADAGLEWARESTGSPLDREEVFDDLQLGAGTWLVGEAPAVTLRPPGVTVTHDTVVAGLRELTLAVDPGTDAETVRFRVTAPAGIVGLGDAVLDGDGRGVTRILHHGRPQDSVFVLTVRQDPGLTTLDLEILQHHQRPWTLIGNEAWTRPADLAPNVMNQSDRAVVRSSLRLLLDGVGAPGQAALAPLDPTDPAALQPDTLPVVPDTTSRPVEPDTTARRVVPDTTRHSIDSVQGGDR